MMHRGPDDSGSWWLAEGHIGLAQRRLAIIDLSPGGHQPMHYKGNRLSVVFNGEITYVDLRDQLKAKGHQFSSQSDTESPAGATADCVDCLAHLNGMFAIALYGIMRRRFCLLARDRAGEKPLFDAVTADQIRFSSELKGLMADQAFPRQIDPTGARLLFD